MNTLQQVPAGKFEEIPSTAPASKKVVSTLIPRPGARPTVPSAEANGDGNRDRQPQNCDLLPEEIAAMHDEICKAIEEDYVRRMRDGGTN